MRIQSIRDGIKKIVNNNTIGKSEYHMQQLEEKLQQIQMSINVENGYNVTIKQTGDFI
jgi:predicted Zn-dependent protease